MSEAVTASVVDVAPLLVDIPTGSRLLGNMRRGRIYELIAAGEIESRKICGRRKLVYRSLVEYVSRDRETPTDAARRAKARRHKIERSTEPS